MTDGKITLNNWLPPLGYRASWSPTLGRHTEREAILLMALDSLVTHDNAVDTREDNPNCIELQHAMRVLNRFAGNQLWKPRT